MNNVEDLQRAIREEERRLMAIEEERKWREYEEAAEHDAAEAKEFRAAMPPLDQMNGSAIDVSVPQSEGEIEDAIRWMKTPRSLKLQLRNSAKEFRFVLMETDSAAAPSPSDAMYSYRLSWLHLDADAVGAEEGIEGFVNLRDVAEVKRPPGGPTGGSDASLFTLVLKKGNPQAVKNSGGLLSINVRTSSPDECALYRSGLMALVPRS